MAAFGAAVLGTAAFVAGVALFTGAIDLGGSHPSGDLSVTEETPVTAMDQGVGWANNSPSLAADPADDRFVVIANRLDAPDFSCALQVSGEGGRSWLTAYPVPKRPEGVEKCYAPEVAFDADGALQYLFVGLAGPGNEPVGAYLTSSTDRGRTWSEPRQVLPQYSFGVRMAIDRSTGDKGRMHLVWIRASDPPSGGFAPPPNPIMTAYSDDGGATFSPPVQISGDIQRAAGPALVLGPDSAVHVAYYDLQDDVIDYQGLEGNVWEDTWSLVVASSTDGGRRFGPGVVVDDQIRPHERVMLIFTMAPPALVAGGDGRVCAAWTDARHGDADAVLRCSTDGGARWGELHRLNDDPVGNGRTQYLPRLSVAPDGRLDAVFYDRRDDEDDILNNVSYTFSTDGGESFTANRRLTRDPSTSLIGQEYLVASAKDMVEFGSRIGVLSKGDEVVAAWTDTRNSNPLSTGQDIFATVVELETSGQPLWARVAGGLLAVAGLAALAFAVVRGRRSGAPKAGDAPVSPG
ncbi:MAG: glycoside hydrolase [Actinomycetota bacterium]|nr:glycoside hydrolase [Actinomycetota bacterium]